MKEDKSSPSNSNRQQKHPAAAAVDEIPHRQQRRRRTSISQINDFERTSLPSHVPTPKTIKSEERWGNILKDRFADSSSNNNSINKNDKKIKYCPSFETPPSSPISCKNRKKCPTKWGPDCWDAISKKNNTSSKEDAMSFSSADGDMCSVELDSCSTENAEALKWYTSVVTQDRLLRETIERQQKMKDDTNNDDTNNSILRTSRISIDGSPEPQIDAKILLSSGMINEDGSILRGVEDDTNINQPAITMTQDQLLKEAVQRKKWKFNLNGYTKNKGVLTSRRNIPHKGETQSKNDVTKARYQTAVKADKSSFSETYKKNKEKTKKESTKDPFTTTDKNTNPLQLMWLRENASNIGRQGSVRICDGEFVTVTNQ